MTTPSAIEEREAARQARAALIPIANLRAALRFATRSLPAGTDRVPGTTLRLYREAAHVSSGDVARVLDVSKQMLSKMEGTSATIESAGRFRAAVDILAADR